MLLQKKSTIEEKKKGELSNGARCGKKNIFFN